MLKEKINHFKEYILEKRFYEAHEVLEEIWFPIRRNKGDLDLVLKGFINGAVSMELFKLKRFEPCYNIYKVYLKYVTIERIQKTDFQEDFYELKEFMDKEFQPILELCPPHFKS